MQSPSPYSSDNTGIISGFHFSQAISEKQHLIALACSSPFTPEAEHLFLM